jgi:hypothetical protein
MVTKKSTVKYDARVKETAALYGIPESKVREVDAKAKETGNRPLSFLGPMLQKMRNHIPDLTTRVNALLKMAKEEAPKKVAKKTAKKSSKKSSKKGK